MTNTTSTRPEDLREEMISDLRTAGHLHSTRIEQAFRTVPRHRFVPAASPEDAYANKAITIKPGADRPASCISVPTVVAMMLDQLDPQTGDHVLEIGAGTGYNAALLTELVGDTGSVTTVDIRPDVTDHTRNALSETGYNHVRVVTGDGALGEPDHAPTTKSSSPSDRGTCPRPGSTSSHPAERSWSRCTGAAKPAASHSLATTRTYEPRTASSAASSP